MGKKKKKDKIIPLPPLPPEVGEDEIEVSDEDFEFIKENRDYAGFVKRIDTNSITRHIVGSSDKKEDALESNYERRMNVLKKKNEEGGHTEFVNSLPIKTADGKVFYKVAPRETTKPVSQDQGTQKAGMIDDLTRKPTKSERRQQLKKAKKQQKVQEEEERIHTNHMNSVSGVLESVKEEISKEEALANKKSKLAEIGVNLLTDPEKNISSLKDLLQMCHDDDKSIVKLAVLSLYAVFKDIIPGYQIRLPTEKELVMVVSKDVKKRRFYESTLLRSYQAYLQKLTILQKDSCYQHVSVRCLCNLLAEVPHFNYRDSLLVEVVKNVTSSDDAIRKLCCNTVRSLFLNEGKHNGEATVEATQLIAKSVKVHDCDVHPDCIEVFLSLSFDEDLAKPEPVDAASNKKKRKRDKHGKHELKNDAQKSNDQKSLATKQEVDADSKAISSVPDSSERRNMQSQILSSVMGTYFRILKHIMYTPSSKLVDGSKISTPPVSHSLLIPALKGLGKFSHLISIDYMGDLLKCLKTLAGGKGDGPDSGFVLSVPERLQCCIVAFKVMRSNLDALNVDLQEFFVHFYNLLFEYRPARENHEVLGEALKVMLYEGRQHDMHRASAFIKRLASFSLCFGSAEAMAALVTIRHLLQKNSKCQSMLENDEGGGSLAGPIVKYDPETTDPNLSGALAAVLWELNLLGKHYHPAVSKMASGISTMGDNQSQVYLSSLTPQQGYSDFAIDQEQFLPPKDPLKPIKGHKKKRNSCITLIPASVEETAFEEDCLRKSFSRHFSVVKAINENERLRKELDTTSASIRMHDVYKNHKRKRKEF